MTRRDAEPPNPKRYPKAKSFRLHSCDTKTQSVHVSAFQSVLRRHPRLAHLKGLVTVVAHRPRMVISDLERTVDTNGAAHAPRAGGQGISS